jgi:uncharacterized protein
MNDADHLSASSKNTARLAPLEQNMAAEFARRVRERMGGRVFCMRVFGSRARGEAREDSDLDILVLLNEASLKDKREISDIATDLFLEMVLPFEVAPRVMAKIDYDELKSRELLFPREIERDGIPV